MLPKGRDTLNILNRFALTAYLKSFLMFHLVTPITDFDLALVEFKHRLVYHNMKNYYICVKAIVLIF